MATKVRFFPPVRGPWSVNTFDLPTSSSNAVITIDPAAAAFYDAPPLHEQRFNAHGWTAVCDVGDTAADRPAGHTWTGRPFYQVDLAAFIFFDGSVWRNVSGAAV